MSPLNYIRIFLDETVSLEKVDGEIINCTIQSSKNNLSFLESLPSDLLDLHELIVTVSDNLDIPILIGDIHSIERHV